MTLIELILSIAVITLFLFCYLLYVNLMDNRRFTIMIAESLLSLVAPDVLEKANKEIKRQMGEEE